MSTDMSEGIVNLWSYLMYQCPSGFMILIASFKSFSIQCNVQHVNYGPRVKQT